MASWWWNVNRNVCPLTQSYMLSDVSTWRYRVVKNSRLVLKVDVPQSKRYLTREPQCAAFNAVDKVLLKRYVYHRKWLQWPCMTSLIALGNDALTAATCTIELKKLVWQIASAFCQCQQCCLGGWQMTRSMKRSLQGDRDVQKSCARSDGTLPE